MSSQKTISIYTLSCPKTGAVRYVGATINPKARLSNHKVDAKRKNSAPVHKWIRSLLDEGLEPVMDILDSGNTDDWGAKEKHWIQYYKDAECDLLNQTNGGVNCEYAEETRRKLSGLKFGENNPMYGKSPNEDTLKKRSGENHPMYGLHGEDNPNYGKRRTEEQRKKMSEAHRNRRTTPTE